MTSSSSTLDILGPDFRPLDNAILFATINALDTPPYALGPVIANAARATHKRLIIVLLSRLFNTGKRARSRSPAARRKSSSSADAIEADSVLSRVDSWDDVQRLLTYIYVQATKVAQDMGKVLLDVDVLLRGFDEDLSEDLARGMDVVFRVQGDSIPVPLPESIGLLHTAWAVPGDAPDVSSSNLPFLHKNRQRGPSTYPVVAVGGTFDHLHAGHKILLSMTAWIAEKKVIVGVTDDALLTKKSNKEVMEDLPTRTRRVHNFLARFKPGLTYDVVTISDVYGPTGWDPNIQALVVSRETVSGAESIAKHRAEKGLPPLTSFVIDVISHNDTNLDSRDVEMLKATKMSSTFIREWIVKQNSSAVYDPMY